MSKNSASLQIVKATLNIFWREKRLIIFPFLSAVNITVFIFGTLLLLKAFLPGVDIYDEGLPRTIFYFFFYLGIFFLYYVFFGCCIVGANMVINGEKVSLIKCFGKAIGKSWKLFLWSILWALTIALGDKVKKLNIIFKGLFMFAGLSLEALSFFIVPIILLEDVSMVEAIKKSGFLFVKNWGKIAVGQISIVGVFSVILFISLFALPIATLIFMIAFPNFPDMGKWVILAIETIFLLSLAAIGMVVDQIFVTVLYKYASTGEVPQGFSKDHLENTFKSIEKTAGEYNDPSAKI